MKNIRVLLVDDEIFNFEMLNTVLGTKIKLSYASSGRQGLSLSIEELPQVVLLDVCMPGLDGYDTCRLLKNTPETKNIPIILLTGLDNQQEVKEGFMAGCDAYITKPFEMTELMTKIEQLSDS